MSYTTNVPQPTFGANGFIAPSESAILTGVTLDLNAAFGTSLNFTNLETPQGQLASSFTAEIGDCNDQFVYYTNQVDPQFAQGRMQDALGRIYFLTRLPASATEVVANCMGGTGVVIPVGALAQDTNDNLYACTAAGTINSSGTVAVPFQCTETGPTICPPNALSTIYQTIPGWDSIANPSAGAAGSVVESRAAFELRRQQSVALNSVASVQSILALVQNVPDVVDAYVVDNFLPTPTVIGGVTLASNSVYVAAVGGIAQAIGDAIWLKKPPGCNYNGNTTVTVTDTSNGYATPPSYQVTFEIPTNTTVYFAVTLKNNVLVPSGYAALVQGAIQTAFAGADGGSRARIGSQIFASRFYAGIAALGTWSEIISVFVGFSASPTGNYVTMAINQEPVTSSAYITVSLA